jgi:peroxiredoxin
VPIVGISVDDRETSAAFARELHIPFPLLYDDGLGVASAYGLAQADKDVALPATLVVDRNRRIRWRRVGERMDDRPSVAEILAAVDALRAEPGRAPP